MASVDNEEDALSAAYSALREKIQEEETRSGLQERVAVIRLFAACMREDGGTCFYEISAVTSSLPEEYRAFCLQEIQAHLLSCAENEESVKDLFARTRN